MTKYKEKTKNKLNKKSYPPGDRHKKHKNTKKDGGALASKNKSPKISREKDQVKLAATRSVAVPA